MIKFGTSGFRGVIGENFNKENVQKIAYALTKLIKQEKEKFPCVHIGYDNRFMGEIFAKWFSEVLIYEKIKVVFYDTSMPTPVVAYMSKDSAFGVVLTASHNPYYYNGIKIIRKSGEIPDDFANKIERIANKISINKIKTKTFEDGVQDGTIIIQKNTDDYEKSVLSFLNKKKIKNENPKILFNAMHGNSSKTIRSICKKLKLENYEIMNENIDPYFEFGLPAPYLKNLTAQAVKVKKEKYDIGIALDGDSDRITCIDSSGEIYDCNYILVLLLDYLISEKNFKGGVVHNTAFTNLISLIAKKYNQPEYIAKVGFKNIAEKLSTTDAFIGGETNGVAIKKHILGKDGIIGAFLVIDMLCHYKKSLKKLLNDLEKNLKFPSCALEFAYPIDKEKKDEITNKVFIFKELPQLNQEIVKFNYEDGAKFTFSSGYWTMVRFSGNENVVRIFAEMPNEEECQDIILKMEKFVGVKERQ